MRFRTQKPSQALVIVQVSSNASQAGTGEHPDGKTYCIQQHEHLKLLKQR